MTSQASASRAQTWRTPAVILLCGCGIATLAFGPRSALGIFQTPILEANGWGRDTYSVALALQNILWGLGQPFAGAIGDRFGLVKVLWAGMILYAAGLVMMAFSTTPEMLTISAGVLIGFGLSASSFSLILSAFGKLLPPEWRSLGFGLGTAAGSFGQFLFSPLAVALIKSYGWQAGLIAFAGGLMIAIPLAFALATPRHSDQPGHGGLPAQTLREQIAQALGHRSYILLVIGFFTCGFQLQFITVHMPSYLIDQGLSAAVGGWTIAVIGLFNIVGSVTAGWLGSRMPKRYILSIIYFTRALAVLAFISFPVTATSAMMFGAVMGFMWLSTVPPTNGLILVMFGTRWLAMLAGFAFFSHQVGGTLGVLLGGFVFEQTGSYNLIWYLSILFGVMSALINLPIVEQPAPRAAAAPA